MFVVFLPIATAPPKASHAYMRLRAKGKFPSVEGTPRGAQVALRGNHALQTQSKGKSPIW